MANKNKQVIIGYFPNKAAATEAAQQLKDWDKAHDDIKLGGTGILTWEDGKVKTRKVGNRATGTGVKWGLILGAATGILSGGITLLGGALVGVAGGAVAGALYHKHLGLTDADKERLTQHLMNGGAAVVVMADDFEVESTKAELASLGGQVENYAVPEETVEQVEEAVEVEEIEGEAEDHVDERVVIIEEDIPAVVAVSGRIQNVEGIGPSRAEALIAAGITTRQELLDRGATPEGRAEIAAQTQISEKLITKWVSAVDLSRVKGVGAQYGELLQAAGVASVLDLAEQDAASLREQLVALNATNRLVREVPGEAQLDGMIEAAKSLPQAIIV
ncbi:MAG: DUF4332 domain-containing protein [Anaerolineae bacterium]|nr:DUF4332 domain-containing protein [Anaerolineae bacterium]MCB0203571.1 DUF4332 domain-containing protein [Anaerolineae bacterium]MCB0255450.1 DUF4332 domain-containing protein [Anaerolineae bacterium]